MMNRPPIAVAGTDAAAVARVRGLQRAHPGLSQRAALGAALCLQQGAGLCSYDAALDAVADLTRYEP